MLSGNGLPRTGGSRPQVLVHIDYEQLVDQWRSRPRKSSASRPRPDHPEEPLSSPPDHPSETRSGPPGPPPEPTSAVVRTGQRGGISEATFVGPIHPAHVRALACDAELIPVVLGGEGEVLDVGTGDRHFTGRLRQAVIARDGGCTAPGLSLIHI